MFNKRIRAWHKENAQMYKVETIYFAKEKVRLVSFMEDVKESLLVDFDEVVVMQESGMQDDKGLNAFQGDLIRWEDSVFVLMYGDYGDSCTKVNGYGWHLAGEEYTFVYVGGGEKIGNTFENPVVEK